MVFLGLLRRSGLGGLGGIGSAAAGGGGSGGAGGVGGSAGSQRASQHGNRQQSSEDAFLYDPFFLFMF